MPKLDRKHQGRFAVFWITNIDVDPALQGILDSRHISQENLIQECTPQFVSIGHYVLLVSSP
jgi:hypothetical protein